MRFSLLLLAIVLLAFPTHGASLSQRQRELWEGEYELHDSYVEGKVEVKAVEGHEFSVLITMRRRDTEDCEDGSGCSFEGTLVPSGLRATAVRSGHRETDRIFLEIDGDGRLGILPVTLDVAAMSCPSDCAPDFAGVFRKKTNSGQVQRPPRQDMTKAKVLISRDGSPMKMIQAGPVRQRINEAPGEYRYAWSNISVDEFWVDQTKVRCWQYSTYCVVTGKNCSPCTDAFAPQQVTFQEAQDYAQYYGLRLPTYYEWLKISTGGIESLHFAGNTPLRLRVPRVPGLAFDGSSAPVRFDVLDGMEWAVSGNAGCPVGERDGRDLLLFDHLDPQPAFFGNETAGLRCVTDSMVVAR